MPHKWVISGALRVWVRCVMETTPKSTAGAEHLAMRSRVPDRLQHELRRLLEQQFWLFGWDIRRAEGNLLSTLGFERTRQPVSLKRPPSRYECCLESGVTITLWGFGMMWRDAELGAVFLSRHAFTPRYCRTPVPLSDVWTPDALPGLERPSCSDERACCQSLVLDALAWIGWYERFVHDLCAAAYRTEAISAWRTPLGSGEDLIARWDDALVSLAQVYGMPPRVRSQQKLGPVFQARMGPV